MRQHLRGIALAAVLVGSALSVTACNNATPTAPAAAPGASFDSGVLIGSGHGAGSGDAGSATTTSDSSSTGRTGVLIGSGH